MGARKAPLDPVADLKRRLSRSRALGPCLHAWWRDHDFADHPATVGKRVAIALIEQRQHAAGTAVLAELLADQLRLSDLGTFARLFADGHFTDPPAIDRFAIDVLAQLIDTAPGRVEIARVIAGWRGAETACQRRAACVAFVPHVADPALAEHAFAICAHVVWSHDPCDHTAVGWLLGELAGVAPERATMFFRRHARLMSRACARKAVAKLPDRDALLSHHRRSTTAKR
jgi:hypothetical protein